MVTFDEGFEIDFRPAVPATVRAELNKLLKGTKRIVVYEVVAENKTAKVNGIRLTTSGNSLPRESFDDIAEGVSAIMHRAWLDQETEDPDIGLPPIEFVVVCEHDGKGRKRGQFRYVYKGHDEPDYAEENYSSAELVQQRALELLERVNVQAFSTIHDYQTKFLEIVQQNTSQAAAGAAIMQHAIPLFLSANQQVLNAATLKFDTARLDAQERATTERMTAALKFVAPFLGLAAQQFIAHKFGISMPVPDMGPANGAPGPGHGDAAHPDDEVPPEHLLAAMANTFGEQLTNRQRAELNRILTKKQLACFDALFVAETDDDAIAAYQQVAQHAMDKLGVLQSMLTPEQGQTLAVFMQAAAQYQSPPPE